MSVDHHIAKICNNIEQITFNDKVSARCFFQLQLDAYKKCIMFLNSFKSLISDLSSKTFSVYNNKDRINEIINVSMSILYGNLISVLTVKYKTKQIFNISTTQFTEPGYKILINYSRGGTKQIMSYKINSIRLQFNELATNMIKIVHNNTCNIPESVIFIGKRLDENDTDSMLDEYSQSINLAIDKLKVHEYTFICLLNNFNAM